MLGVMVDGPLGPGGPSSKAVPATPPDSGDIAERHALAILVSVDGLGPATLGRLMARFGGATQVVAAAQRRDARALLAATRHEQRQAPAAVIDALIEQADDADAVIRRIERSAVELVSLHDAQYPARLRTIELPPHLLFLRGNRSALATSRAVAVVGTRRPSESGRLVAARIASAIARTGAAVVSGLAVGIDGAAHAATLAEGGVTIGVLGGGHDRLFPRSHRKLVDAIVDGGGAVVSELPPGAGPTRGTFPRRNRIVSGLAEATVVVEAGARSGALITAHWALEQGRECFVVPGPIDRPTSAGCLSLLRDAAGAARVVAGVPQLLEDLDLVEPLASDRRPASRLATAALVELGDVPRRVAEEILRGRTTTDEIVSSTRYPVATVLTALTVLEARGLVVDAYGRYRPVGHLATQRPPAGRTVR
jgi:DNA processing protein